MISKDLREKITTMFALYFPFTYEEILEVLEKYKSIDILAEGIERSMKKEPGELSLKHACKEANNVLNKNTK